MFVLFNPVWTPFAPQGVAPPDCLWCCSWIVCSSFVSGTKREGGKRHTQKKTEMGREGKSPFSDLNLAAPDQRVSFPSNHSKGNSSKDDSKSWNVTDNMKVRHERVVHYNAKQTIFLRKHSKLSHKGEAPRVKKNPFIHTWWVRVVIPRVRSSLEGTNIFASLTDRTGLENDWSFTTLRA